jgi:hypothetical protein
MKHLLLLSLLLLGGCIGNSLSRKTWNRDGRLSSELKVNNLKGMVNTSTGSLVFEIKDRNDFTAYLVVIDSNVVHSPESATAIFDGLTNLSTGGASGVVSDVVERK